MLLRLFRLHVSGSDAQERRSLAEERLRSLNRTTRALFYVRELTLIAYPLLAVSLMIFGSSASSRALLGTLNAVIFVSFAINVWSQRAFAQALLRRPESGSASHEFS
jgi:hypothetical protein